MVFVALGLVGVCILHLVWRDVDRLEVHLSIAKILMARGMSEEDAMELSGCNFWDEPWFVRMLHKYPSLPAFYEDY